MFESTKQDLKDILRWADEGRLQLPDFQRDYVWGDEDVKSLIASVAKGFPVGALLTLRTGGEVRFKPRLLAGVAPKEIEPEELLLDGQQRITSLFQSTFSDKPVRTRNAKGAEIERYYYIDIMQAVSAGANLEDAIIGVPANHVIKKNFGKDIELDLSTPEAEYEHHMFPLNKAFDSRKWLYDWRDYWKAKDVDIGTEERDFHEGVLERILRYEMPIIRLDKRNTREAICLVFEKVNVGGKKLDAFELVTAIFAADEFDLREDWYGPIDRAEPGRKQRILGHPIKQDVLTGLANTDFLQACTLLHTLKLRSDKMEEGVKGKELPQVSCRRDALLGLPLKAYRQYADVIEQGFVEAGKFLNEQKIIWHKDVPYPPQLVTLAATFAILGRTAQSAAAKEKLSRWFWSIVLGELYSSTTETRLARDVPDLIAWLPNDDAVPRSVQEAIMQVDRFLTLRSRNSAAYKGVHALLMREGCEDFITQRPTDLMTFFNDKIDIHHIFPQAWCKKQGIPPSSYNSIANKTPLSKQSNISIGGDAPSVYLKRIEEKEGISTDQLDAILQTHLIAPELLRTDDYDAFFSARMHALANLASTAMGKLVVVEHGTNEPETDVVEAPEDEEPALEAAE